QVLAREVAVKRRDADLGGLRDLFHRRPLEPLPLKERQGRLEDPLACTGGLAFPESHAASLLEHYHSIAPINLYRLSPSVVHRAPRCAEHGPDGRSRPMSRTVTTLSDFLLTSTEPGASPDALPRPDAPDWVPAVVPGGVHESLLAAGRIPHPYRDENEKAIRWIEE